MICTPKISLLNVAVNLFLSIYETIYISWVCARGNCRSVYCIEKREGLLKFSQ